ncbi:MAG: hypothetical protein WCL47_08295 [Holophagaceae bacterium]
MAVGSVSAVNSNAPLSTDPRDLNGDGKVTAAEIQAYAIRNPQPKKPEASEAKAQEAAPTTPTGLIDLYV